MASRLWARVIINHRIAKQDTVECTWGDEKDALREICRGFDIPVPMWLHKQEHEYDAFRGTAFTKENFLEDVAFDKLEIEFIDGQKRRSDDPRNQF